MTIETRPRRGEPGKNYTRQVEIRLCQGKTFRDGFGYYQP